MSLGLFDGSSGMDRPVEFALQNEIRDPEGYYRVAVVELALDHQFQEGKRGRPEGPKKRTEK